jgi:hypothetical protein
LDLASRSILRDRREPACRILAVTKRGAQASGSFVYHRVPEGLRGSVLYPLNQLKGIYPDLYLELRKRYATREDIASLRIPPLANCLWNDVLHLSPVHPMRLNAALGAAGHELPSDWRRFFEIDANLLDPAAAVIYKLLTPFWSGQFNVVAASALIGEECLPFDPELLPEFGNVPLAAREYYASVPAGSSVALFLGVPHVLYRGRIDLKVDGVKVIEV